MPRKCRAPTLTVTLPRPAEVTALQIYTIHSPLDYLQDLLLTPFGAAAIHAFHWYYSRPPVLGLEFEADLRGVRRELRLF